MIFGIRFPARVKQNFSLLLLIYFFKCLGGSIFSNLVLPATYELQKKKTPKQMTRALVKELRWRNFFGNESTLAN